MSASQNGWSAGPGMILRPLVVGGIAFVPGIRHDDDVHTVLGYVADQFHTRVEPLRNPGCWGYAFRENRNDPNALSNHASGTAIDCNAPAHPNGVPTNRTFTPKQVAEVHKILAEVDHTVRWGGDYTGTPDAMHFEIDTTPARLAAVADRIRNQEDDMFTDEDRADLKATRKVTERTREGSFKRDKAILAGLDEIAETSTKTARKSQVAALKKLFEDES
ncbi:M15 family metallopeptidase [Nocardioides sp. InS609-2]|uniref:M15 family metallopeptidase n=1 Tax=Nocardioides sp. InS609-2 TaxID=2760705 RepID=UPI0020BEAE31|nr:M15 family metallopeptidase [Nocardioides sp. InS609-2]